MYSLNHFREKINDIARPYHFRCFFEGGCFAQLDSTRVVASMRTASLPGNTIQEVPINFFGMTYKMAGTPTYDPLTATFIIDAEYQTLLDWKNTLENVFKYTEGSGPEWGVPIQYMGTMTLYQLNTQRAPVSVYKMSMAYLSAIGTISYGQDTKDTPLTFDATITYSYYNQIA